jgi:predicted phage terminase large subunit-like protein
VPSATAIPPTATARERAELLERIDRVRETRREWVRRAVLDDDRIDILAQEVLGYEIAPHHLAIARHEYTHPQSLTLVWRGAGKTTIGTVTKAIFAMLKRPNVRILVASKAMANAVSMLSEIKAKLKSPLFVEHFGDLQGAKWDDVEFTISTRTTPAKEATVTAVGVEGSVASKHYDIVIADDLVDEENSRTPLMRGKIKTFYYKTLTPCLEIVCPDGQPGEMHVLGTRYHYHDLYGHLIADDMADSTLTIPALTGNEVDGWVSAWPSRFPVADLVKRRRQMGSIIFDSQYGLDCRAMQGDIFDYDWINVVTEKEVPVGLPRYLGVDLAISLGAKAHLFAIVVIAHDATTDRYYVVDHYAGRRTFADQKRLIVEYAVRHRVIRGAVEAVAYQEAMLHALKDEAPEIIRSLGDRVEPLPPGTPMPSFVPVKVREDKVTRAYRLSATFEDGRVFFLPGQDAVIENIVLFPKGEFDDLYDAFDHAIAATKKRVRKERRKVGLL